MLAVNVAWATGFFVGDGNARLSVSRRVGSVSRDGYVAKHDYVYPDITAKNTDLSLLRRFRATMGFGSVLGPYRNIGYGDGWIYQYFVRGKLAEHVARLPWPFCVSETKKKQLLSILKHRSPPIDFAGIDEQLAWVAGFFEAEGCAFSYIYKHGSKQPAYVNPKISTTNTERGLLEHIKSVVGYGSVSLSHRGTGEFLPIYQFTAECDSAREFASLISPYVVSDSKRTQLSRMEVAA